MNYKQAKMLHDEAMSNHDYRMLAEFVGIGRGATDEEIIEFHKEIVKGIETDLKSTPETV